MLEVKAEGFRLDRGGNPCLGQLGEERRGICQCPWPHTGDGGRRSEATHRLLEQDEVALFWPRPHRRNKTPVGPEHPGNLVGWDVSGVLMTYLSLLP